MSDAKIARITGLSGIVGQLQRLLQRRRLGTRHRGELPADDLVPVGRRHPDSPTRYRETSDRASGMN